jgi:hypothetical protein
MLRRIRLTVRYMRAGNSLRVSWLAAGIYVVVVRERPGVRG